MPLPKIVLKDGSVEAVRSYALIGDNADDGGRRVRLMRSDASEREVSEDEVDLAASFRKNADLDFDPPPSPPGKGEPVLELVAVNEERVGDYIVVEGMVRNIAPVDLGGVVAKAIAETADGQFVTSEEAVIDYNPLRAAGESPFRVVIKTGTGKIGRTRVEFRALLGDPLPTLTPLGDG